MRCSEGTQSRSEATLVQADQEDYPWQLQRCHSGQSEGTGDDVRQQSRR